MYILIIFLYLSGILLLNILWVELHFENAMMIPEWAVPLAHLLWPLFAVGMVSYDLILNAISFIRRRAELRKRRK